MDLAQIAVETNTPDLRRIIAHGEDLKDTYALPPIIVGQLRPTVDSQRVSGWYQFERAAQLAYAYIDPLGSPRVVLYYRDGRLTNVDEIQGSTYHNLTTNAFVLDGLTYPVSLKYVYGVDSLSASLYGVTPAGYGEIASIDVSPTYVKIFKQTASGPRQYVYGAAS